MKLDARLYMSIHGLGWDDLADRVWYSQLEDII